MLSPLVSWMLSASSSSSSTYSSEGGGLESSTANNDQLNDVRPNNDRDNPSTSLGGDTTPAKPGIHATAMDVSRRQTQRLWAKEDEVKLLKRYLDYTNANAQRGMAKPNSSLQNDVASFYDDVKPQLRVEFNQNQLVEKLRRLKRKHSHVWDRIKSGGRRRSFGSPDEEAIFEISTKLWGDPMKMEGTSDDKMTRPTKRPRSTGDDFQVLNPDVNRIKSVVEETLRTCLPPLLKETLQELGTVSNPTLPLGLGKSGCVGGGEDDPAGNWSRERLAELETYSNKLEVVQDHIKAAVSELRSLHEA